MGSDESDKFDNIQKLKKLEKDFKIREVDITFKEELILFVPAFILVSLLVWFFNDKIKAR